MLDDRDRPKPPDSPGPAQALTREERDKLIAAYLETPKGRARFRRAMLHGHPDLRTALSRYYIPLMIAQKRGWRILDGGKKGSS